LEFAYTFQLNYVKIDSDIIKIQRVPSKREVLKVVMAVFDQHGFAALIIVHGKILLQKILRKEI
jgi:hypothetical protein